MIRQEVELLYCCKVLKWRNLLNGDFIALVAPPGGTMWQIISSVRPAECHQWYSEKTRKTSQRIARLNYKKYRKEMVERRIL